MVSAVVYLPVLDFVRAELIINCVLVALVLTVVGLRVVGRLMGVGLGWDDAFIIFCTPIGVAMLVCQGLFARVGNGYSLVEHPQLAANIPFILQLTFGMQTIYVTLLAAVKASMLCFFLRVFPTPFVRRATQITLAFVGVWWISYFCACVFLCTPVSGQWTGIGKCGAYMPMIQSLIASNAVGDLIIITLPLHSIWTLKMRRAEKIGLTLCFTIGLACVVCAVFRIIYISTVDLTSNITGTMPTTVFLFVLEPNLAILCVSIPMLRTFYTMYKKRTGGSRLQEHSQDRYGKKSGTGQSSGNKSRKVPHGPENISVWEMEDYKDNEEAAQHDVKANAYPDESGSEKDLTVASQPLSKTAIGVQTRWSVTRE